MPVWHTDKNGSEAVPGNESSANTASFGKSKHARSLETANNCSATVSNNSANGSVTVESSTNNWNESESDSVIAERSASDLEIKESNKDSTSCSIIAQRSRGARNLGSVKVSLLQSRIEDFQLLSQPKMCWDHVTRKRTMDQHWINNGSTMDQRWINDPSTIIYNLSRTRNVLFATLQYWMECENGDETTWTVQIWHLEILKGTRGGVARLCKTWSFGLQCRLGKHFSDERGLPFYYLKIEFLECLRIFGDIQYPDGPICYWQKTSTNNLERSLYCACRGCNPRLSGGGSELIKNVPLMERLPRRFNIVEHQ